jgi:hypothetical protein
MCCRGLFSVGCERFYGRIFAIRNSEIREERSAGMAKGRAAAAFIQGALGP